MSWATSLRRRFGFADLLSRLPHGLARSLLLFLRGTAPVCGSEECCRRLDDSNELDLCSTFYGRPGRILCLPGLTDSFAPFREPIGHGTMPHNGKAIALPPAHSAGDDNHIIQTLPFEIAGLELREGAALGNQVERFGLEQFA